MKWFEGSIPDAIQLAKSKGSVFIVYITGEDDESKKMDAVWADNQVIETCARTDCVGIRILSNSEACGQFAMFYPVVVVPSVFFIGNDGIPLEVTGGALSAEDFHAKVKSATQTHRCQLANSTPPGASVSDSAAQSSGAVDSSPQPVQDKVERAKALIAERQAKKAEEEQRKSIESEKERRKVGQAMHEAKLRKEEIEAREIQKELRRQKDEDRKARERVKEQIARDRAERAARYQKEKEETKRESEEIKRLKLETQQAEAAEMAARKSEFARLQFRLPDGSSVTQTFPSSDMLSSARDFISQQLGPSFGSPVLSTIYPRKTFSDSDMGESFSNLQLSPTAVIMVLPEQRSHSSVLSSSSSGIISIVLAPFLAIWNFVYNLLFASPAQPRGAYNPGRSVPGVRYRDSEDDNVPAESGSRGNRPRSAYKRRTPASVSRKDGNVHKFSNAEDDDDELATWNGNSTQQM